MRVRICLTHTCTCKSLWLIARAVWWCVRVAVCCIVLQRVAACRSLIIMYLAMRLLLNKERSRPSHNTLAATQYNTHYNTHTTTHFNTLQHTATLPKNQKIGWKVPKAVLKCWLNHLHASLATLICLHMCTLIYLLMFTQMYLFWHIDTSLYAFISTSFLAYSEDVDNLIARTLTIL